MQQHLFGFAKPWLATLAVVVTVLFWSDARAQELEKIIQGYKIAPVTLNLKGKDWALVGLGSYLVNTTGCNDCHTFPNWATGGNPFLGEPEQINTDRYLAGGRPFGPDPVDGHTIVSANITPDRGGLPAGLKRKQFIKLMQSGKDPDDRTNRLLQVMPWPLYKWKTELELWAMYEYLSAIPSCTDPTPSAPAKCTPR
jgi:hypothetical protein